MRKLRKTLEERAVAFLPLLLSAGAQRRHRGAVVIPAAVQDLVFVRPFVFQTEVLPDHLEGLLVCLRTAVGEEHLSQPGHQRYDLAGKPDRRDVSRRARIVGHCLQLLADGVGDGIPSVADIHAPDPARCGIQKLPSPDVLQDQAPAFHHDRGLACLEYPVLHQMMPEIIPVLFQQCFDIFLHHIPFVHDSKPPSFHRRRRAPLSQMTCGEGLFQAAQKCPGTKPHPGTRRSAKAGGPPRACVDPRPATASAPRPR